MSKSKEPLIPSEKKDSVQNNQIKNDILNNEESKRDTKSNSNNDSHNNK